LADRRNQPDMESTADSDPGANAGDDGHTDADSGT
jgi:hypothetical protein